MKTEQKTIDDDHFTYEGGMRQCISGFGRNTIEVIEDYWCEEDDPEDDPLARVRWHINELVRWCRNFNGETQRLEAEVEAAKKERDGLRELLATLLSAAQQKAEQFDELEAWIKGKHNGYCPHAREVMHELREPTTLIQALEELMQEGEELEDMALERMVDAEAKLAAAQAELEAVKKSLKATRDAWWELRQMTFNRTNASYAHPDYKSACIDILAKMQILDAAYALDESELAALSSPPSEVTP